MIDWFSLYCLAVGLAAGWALRCLVERRRVRRALGASRARYFAIARAYERATR